MSNPRGAIGPGILLICFGAWLLARTLEPRLPGLDQLWPLLLVVFAVVFLAQYVVGGQREEGLVFMSAAGMLLGLFLLAVTLGPLDWPHLLSYWPVFVLILGLAFFAQWLARPGAYGLLVIAILVLMVGLVALPVTLSQVGTVLVQQSARLWPLALIFTGLILVGRYVRGLRRARRTS